MASQTSCSIQQHSVSRIAYRVSRIAHLDSGATRDKFSSQTVVTGTTMSLTGQSLTSLLKSSRPITHDGDACCLLLQ